MADKNAVTYVALLRGVNVGGKNPLPMKEARAAFTAIGLSDVATYIQSGNFVFRASAPREVLAEAMSSALNQTFGLNVPVVMRTAGELQRIRRQHPFAADATDARQLHVGFLSQKPELSDVKTLDPERSPPDRFAIKGSNLYLFFPKGSARSKLTVQYFDSRLHCVTTVRNWKTVNVLADMAAAKDAE